MKRLTLLATAVAVAFTVQLQAAEGPANPAVRRIEVKEGGGGVTIVLGEGAGGAVTTNPWGQGKSAATWYIESIDKIVNLTDAQKKSITEIIEARDKGMADWQKANAEKLKTASTAMTEAFKSKDKDAIAKAQKEYQELYAPMHEIMKQQQAKLQNVLTAEQQAKLHESRVTSMIKASAGPVELSPEQLKQIKDAIAKDGNHEAAERKVYEMVQQVLTPDQKTAIAKQRAMSYVKGSFTQAKLTEQQQKQAEAICEELAKDQNVKPMELYQKLKEKVDAILTAEQKEAMKKPLVWNQAGGGFAMPGAPLAGQSAPGATVRMQPDPAIQELRTELQALRRQVEELKELVKKSTEAQKK